MGGPICAPTLDDHAHLIDAILALLQARWRTSDLEFALELADALLRDFEDIQAGGFFFTAHDHERLIQRLKGFSDDAVPSGNGIAAFALARLGHLLGEERYLRAAERTIAAGWEVACQHPTAHLSLLLAVEEQLQPTEIVVIRADEPALGQWKSAAQQRYLPNRLVLGIQSGTALPGLLASRADENSPVAYVCIGTHCLAPVRDLSALQSKAT